MKRGQVWWAELDKPKASEPGYRRPVIIIQSDDFNESRINTVVAIALTTNLRLASAPGNVKLPKAKTGLTKESVANVSQVITLDKRYLSEEIGNIDRRTMLEIDEGIRLVLAL